MEEQGAIVANASGDLVSTLEASDALDPSKSSLDVDDCVKTILASIMCGGDVGDELERPDGEDAIHQREPGKALKILESQDATLLDELRYAEGEDAEDDIEAGLVLGHALGIGSIGSQSSRDARDDVSHCDVDCETAYNPLATNFLPSCDERAANLPTTRQRAATK